MRIRPGRPHLALNALLLVLLIAGLAPVSAAPSVAALGTLSVDGSDPVASDSTCTPCKTIQGAINRAGPGDGITVAPGTYHETLTINQSVSIIGGVARLPGEQGPTIVDAGGAGRVVTIPNTVPSDVLVSLTSLTLTGGVLTGGAAPAGSVLANEVGAGIAALGGTISLSDTTVMRNTALGNGGGIYASNAVTLVRSPVMSNTTTASFSSGHGGGIYSNGAVTLIDSPVMSNTVTNGYNSGGGIYSIGAVTLTRSPVMSNTAAGCGGGISGGTVTLTDSPVVSNTALGLWATCAGGGIYSYNGTVTLTHSPVMNNTVRSGFGGGISGGTVTLTDSPVMSNRADDGGGIETRGGTLTGSPVMSNTAPYGGGGIETRGGTMLVLTSTIAGNTAGAGGGMVVDGGIATLRNSAVVSNTATIDAGGGSLNNGGGILITNSGSLSVTNSTLSANSATASGGAIAYGSAIASPGSLAVSFSTISANRAASGGGISAPEGTTPPGMLPGMVPSVPAMTLNASILAGNTAPSGPDCAGAVTSLGDNLVGNADGCSGVSAAGDLTGSGSSPLDPRLGPLADNGGPTWTMAPQPGSPALDAVPLANCLVSADQWGQPRPDPLYNGACDIGAVEVPAVAPPATPTSAPTLTPTSTPMATSAATRMPRLALVPTSAHVGDRVLVSGRGFGPNELLTLALNGEALAPTTIRTSGQGRFTATFAAPHSLLKGANTVSAVGATSRRVALATVLGRRSTQTYYLAGGVESSTEHAALDLLNTSAQRAHVGYTLYSQTGDTTRGTLAVGAHAARVVPVAGLTSLRGSFGLALSIDRPIAAQLTLTRKGRDGDTILASPRTARRWYLAAGDTARTFHESVAILNPDRTRPAQVRLRLLPSGGGRSRTVTVRVRPHTHLVEDINPLLPGQSLSIIAEASRPVVLERRLTFSRDGHGHDYGLTTRLGTTTPAHLWLLAPGTPLLHGAAYLTLLNPFMPTAHVTLRFYGSSGRLGGSHTIRLNGPGRAQITLPGAGPARGAAGVLTSDQPLVVERAEYVGSPNGTRTAGSDVFGRNGVAPRWSFPGGDTRRGQREVLLLDNPSATPVRVVATLYGSNGQTMRQHVTLLPYGQSTLDVGRSFPGATGVHGVSVTSTNGDGFLAEQTVFAASGSTLQRTQGLAP